MDYKFVVIFLFFLLGTTGAVEKFDLTDKASWVFKKYCYDCHDEDTQKGEIRLDNLSSLSHNARLDLLNKVQEQIYVKEMPPPKKKKQLKEVERQYMVAWVANELKKFNASKLEDKLRYPDYGNYIDHDKLFSGKIKTHAYTPARRWLVSPQIFINRVNAIFGNTGRNVRGSFHGVTNPIILPNNTGVRYYDNSVLGGGHLQLMLNNARTISHKQISSVIPKEKSTKKKGRNPWQPKTVPEAFVTIIKKKSTPSKIELVDAIHAQFECVLQRQATAEELTRYLPHLVTSIKLGGNIEGLRQMLVTVILESEFLYRLELGGGKADAYGRKMLSPREGSYAIAYALSDGIPDDKLVKAAKEGRLISKSDYQREVLRILNDKNSFAGVVDDTQGGRTHRSSHPKINRFFREFFGYPQSIKIFKDLARSDGYYLNTDRRNTRTPGLLIDEADMIVDWHLKKDKNVFVNILTSDKYFVAYNKTPEASKKILSKWKMVYDKMKDTEWKTKGQEVVKTHEAFLSKNLLGKISKKSTRTLTRYMTFFDSTLGQGITPITTAPWSHGNYTVHSPLYNLGGIFGRVGVYFDHNDKRKDLWNYPITQPFKIANRKGILTHPAWLIAHSSNFHTDPIKRGRWVREKLLAGRVPDIPITVDAVIPEDHHKTLRDRVQDVTEQKACYNCHKHMNPLGYTFEMFDDFGRYRLNEPLEHDENLTQKGNGKTTFNVYKTKAVDTNGALSGTGNAKLDGNVKGAFEMIDRMSRSIRVRQSIIRHAFRYFMGRNEMLSDSKTLIDADKAYLKNGGSFQAVIVSLLTSDSFIYRKRIKE
jgi:hypothetical protein